METKQFVCNDCGCRFEFLVLEKGKPIVPEKDGGESQRPAPRPVTCPQCESYNITTA